MVDAKKAAPRNKVPRSKRAVVILKKLAGKDALPAQALAILAVLKGKGGNLAVEELKKAMQGRVNSKQSMSAIWSFYRARLIRKGFIAVAAKAEGK
jgi:hypothetical protein